MAESVCGCLCVAVWVWGCGCGGVGEEVVDVGDEGGGGGGAVGVCRITKDQLAFERVCGGWVCLFVGGEVGEGEGGRKRE